MLIIKFIFIFFHFICSLAHIIRVLCNEKCYFAAPVYLDCMASKKVLQPTECVSQDHLPFTSRPAPPPEFPEQDTSWLLEPGTVGWMFELFSLLLNITVTNASSSNYSIIPIVIHQDQSGLSTSFFRHRTA